MNAVKFLEERFGKDRGNGNGISKRTLSFLLEDYAKVKTEELVMEKEILEAEIKSLKLKLENSLLSQCKCPSI